MCLQLPELRKESRQKYLSTRAQEKLEDLEAEIADDEYLFSSQSLTQREEQDLQYKRTVRDLAKEYKKAGAKEKEERKNRYYMPEENRSKVLVALHLILFSKRFHPKQRTKSANQGHGTTYRSGRISYNSQNIGCIAMNRSLSTHGSKVKSAKETMTNSQTLRPGPLNEATP